QVVLDTLVESASRLCEADTGFLRRREGDTYRLVATFGLSEQQRQHFALYSTKPHRGSLFGRAILEGRAIHIPDVLADSEYDRHQVQKFISVRAGLAVPLMREGVPIGVLGLTRLEPQPFTDKQIDLITTFADQAVIAIENVRLFDEVQARTRELSESLEQQTATSEVLQVISSSPGELEPVFQTMLENATRVCTSKFGTMYLREGDAFRTVAMYGAPPAYIEARMREPVFSPGAGTGLGRAAQTKQVVHIADVTADRAYTERDPLRVAAVEHGGVRTNLSVPMLKENELIGVISIYRQEVRPFTDKQIELLSNLPAQAVIAIENTRLLKELRQRTDDLSQALEQQTATSDVLKVISNSPTDLTPVFEAILTNATRLCEGNLAALWRYDGKLLVGTAQYNASPAFVNRFMGAVLEPSREGPVRLAALEQGTVHVGDITVEPGYSPKVLQYERARTVLAVPLIRDTDLVGIISIWRREVRPFNNKQIELVQNFAAQAVIAI